MSYCNRRKIECWIYDKEGKEIGYGVNGLISGGQDKPCTCPDKDVPAGTGGPQTRCYGIHAEIAAIFSVVDLRDAYSTYTTKAPCYACCRTLLGTPIKRIEFEIPDF